MIPGDLLFHWRSLATGSCDKESPVSVRSKFERRKEDLCCHLLAVFSRRWDSSFMQTSHCSVLRRPWRRVKMKRQHGVLACRLRVGCNSATLFISYYYTIRVYSDSLATKPWAGRKRIRGSIPSREENFLFSVTSIPSSETNQSVKLVQGTVSLGVKRKGCEADY